MTPPVSITQVQVQFPLSAAEKNDLLTVFVVKVF